MHSSGSRHSFGAGGATPRSGRTRTVNPRLGLRPGRRILRTAGTVVWCALVIGGAIARIAVDDHGRRASSPSVTFPSSFTSQYPAGAPAPKLTTLTQPLGAGAHTVGTYIAVLLTERVLLDDTIDFGSPACPSGRPATVGTTVTCTSRGDNHTVLVRMTVVSGGQLQALPDAICVLPQAPGATHGWGGGFGPVQVPARCPAGSDVAA